VWPSEIFSPKDPRIINTIKKIREKNEKNYGIYRYPNDKYDGMVNFGKLTLGGAGFWPLLNFWMSIYYSKLGDKKNASKYFNSVIKRVDKYIPEQIFNNKKQISVLPLCWSHAMFVIAAKELGHFS